MPRLVVKVKSIGNRPLINKLNKRLTATYTKREWMVAEPLKRTVNSIRQRLLKDTATAQRFDHIYTGRMYAATEWRMLMNSPDKTIVGFGYFVPYGMAFEMGARPRWVPMAAIGPWAVYRGLDPHAVQRSIAKKGTKSYPIVQRSWMANQANYLKIVYGRFWQVWR